MYGLQIRLFGAPSITLADGSEIELSSEKARALLAYLAVEADQAHRREKLVGLLWPDFTEGSARANLRRALADLRLAIGDQQAMPPFLHITWETIQFNLASAAWVDANAFKTLLESKLHTRSLQPAEIASLAEAATLYRRPFLDGFSVPDSAAFEEWELITREKFHRQALQCLHRLSEAYQENGEYEGALEYAYRQVEMEPWQESGHRQIMQLLALTGQRAAALAQYQTCRGLLEKELSTCPSEETQILYDQLRQGQWPLAGKDLSGRATRLVGDCPYRGLSAFREQDTPFFFGREGYATRLLDCAWGQNNTTALIGSSGSGKSSLVFASLLPSLRSENEWLITYFRPGGQPFQSFAAALLPLLAPEINEAEKVSETQKLAKALQDHTLPISDWLGQAFQKHPPSNRLFLVIDQFEELYTLCDDPQTRQDFVDLLLVYSTQAKSRLHILITLRADFMGQVLANPALAEILQTGSLLLGPMTRNELRRAIEKPAEKQGAAFEPGLVDRILDDVGEEPGNLPLLEFALLLLWERQSAGWLTHTAYVEIGQAQGALATHAEQVYNQIDKDSQAQLRRIFVQLVRPGEGTEDTRRLATRTEIGETNWPLVRLLADKRLVVTAHDASLENETAEVAHEALIQRWERLKGWIETDRAFRTWQEGLRSALRQWETSNKDEGTLLRGAPLAQAEGWLTERRTELSEVETEFIQASLRQRQLIETERETQHQQELASERFRRRLLGALAGVLALAVVIALTLSIFSLQQRRQALQAYSLSMAANARNALENRDTATALALALAANQINHPPLEAQRVLMDAAYAPGARWRGEIGALFPGTNGPVRTLAISPDGQTALSGLDDGTLILWETASSEEKLRLQGHTGRVNDVVFSPDGSMALSGGDDQQVILWNLASGMEIHRFNGHTGVVRTVDFSPDGKYVVSGGFAGEKMLAPGELILWDLNTGVEIQRFVGHISGIVTARFTPDGRELLASSGDAEIFADRLAGESLAPVSAPFDLILWETESGKAIRTFDVGNDDAFSLAISSDGTKALVGSFYNKVLDVWDLNSGERLQTLKGHTEGVRAVAFSPDGQRALSGSSDDSLILWDLQTGELVAQLKGHGSDVLDLAVSPDGRNALSSGSDDALIQWDLVDAQEIQRLAGHGDMVYDVAFNPNGRQALSVSGAAAPSAPVKDASLRLWNLATGRELRSQPLEFNATFQVAISPDGSTALLASDRLYVLVWDVANWRETGRLEGHRSAVTSIEFTPDGKRALSLGVDGTLILWDVPARQVIRSMKITGQGLWSLAISPDGHFALSDSGDSSMILWDLNTGAQIRTFLRADPPAEPGSTGMAFLPDGKRAISCEQDGLLIEWNLETGKEIRRLGQHASLRTRIVISSDSSLAMTSGMDGSLMLWDLKTGELVRHSSGHGIIFDLALSPDNRSVLFGSSDQMVYQWRVDNPTLDELRQWIQAYRYVRGLTCEEQKIFQIKPIRATPCSAGLTNP